MRLAALNYHGRAERPASRALPTRDDALAAVRATAMAGAATARGAAR